MADELQLSDIEREAALQLMQLSEGETTTATSSSYSCGGSVTFNRPEINTNSVVVIDNVAGDNDGKKRDLKMKRKTEDDFDDDDDDGVICNLMRSKIRRRYRSIIEIYKATKPLI